MLAEPPEILFTHCSEPCAVAEFLVGQFLMSNDIDLRNYVSVRADLHPYQVRML